MNRLLLLISLSIVLMASSCPTQDTTPVNFPEEVRDNFNHDVLSLWIYEESQTRALDSVLVTLSELGQALVSDQYQRDAPSRHSQFLKLTLHHSNLFGTGPQYTRADEVALYSWQDGLTEWMRSAYLEAGFDWAPGFSRDSLHANYEVDGRIYSNVVQVTDSADRNFSGALSHNYYAPAFGLVRKEIPSRGTAWNLKEAYLR